MPEDRSTELATLVRHRGQAVVAHTFNPSTQETEADGSCELKGTLDYMKLIQSKRETIHAKMSSALGITGL